MIRRLIICAFLAVGVTAIVRWLLTACSQLPKLSPVSLALACEINNTVTTRLLVCVMAYCFFVSNAFFVKLVKEDFELEMNPPNFRLRSIFRITFIAAAVLRRVGN